jgi:ABC-2 type transport system permease protein
VRRARMVLAQARLETRLLIRSSESLLVTLGIPLGVLVFFATIPVLPIDDVDAATFLVPGVLALSATATGLVASAIQTAYERKSGALKLLGATPLGRGGFVAAKLTSVMAILALQTALVLAVAAGPLGWRPAGGALGLVAAVGLTALTGLVMTALGLLLAGTLTAELTTAVSNAVFLSLLLLGGVAVPADVLPATAATLGAATPLGAAVAALRAVLDATGGGAAALAVLVVWGAVGAVLASWRFRFEP